MPLHYPYTSLVLTNGFFTIGGGGGGGFLERGGGGGGALLFMNAPLGVLELTALDIAHP